LALATAKQAEEQVAFVRQVAGEFADDQEFQVLIQIVRLTENRRAAAEQLVASRAAVRAPEMTVEDALETPFLLIGTLDQIEDQIRANRERFGFTHLTVHEPFLGTLGPLIERLR
jgi:alkanesulfonate monooxygenase SsuD/methylene tetrahydromethanopterin reductase-like flavin-dependent oxidoreductase (luciferase family)